MKLETVLRLPVMAHRFSWTVTNGKKTVPEYLRENMEDTPWLWHTILGWLFVHDLGKIVGLENLPDQGRKLIDEWILDKTIANQLLDLGVAEETVERVVSLVKLLTRRQQWFEIERPHQTLAHAVLDSLLRDVEVRECIQVNEHTDVLWFNKESFEELLFWLMLVAVVEIGSRPLHLPAQVVKEIEKCHGIIQKIQEAEMKSEYQIEKILMALKGD